MTQIPTVDLGGGVTMPMVGFGTWQLGGRRAYEAVRYALEAGYRHLDTATMYRNEHEVGQALRESGLDRDEVFVTTKLQPGNADRARAILAESLRALGTSQVDLWLIHWPPRRQTSVPLWREFLALRDEGLCRPARPHQIQLRPLHLLPNPRGSSPPGPPLARPPPRSPAWTSADARQRSVANSGSLGGPVRRRPGPGR
jgi:2,5-diketo-D-gluconate reductase A